MEVGQAHNSKQEAVGTLDTLIPPTPSRPLVPLPTLANYWHLSLTASLSLPLSSFSLHLWAKSNYYRINVDRESHSLQSPVCLG